MCDQFYYRNVPAFSYPFIQLSQSQLDFLLNDTRAILEGLERAKKGAVVLDHFQSRLRQKQAVRCTPQSVRVTAAARYAPQPDDLDLTKIPTSLFIHLITYLPLPEIRVLAANQDALREATKISMCGDVDQRWGTYYTCLGAVNQEWAQLFFNEIQKHLANHNSESTDHLTGTTADGGVEADYVAAQSITYALHDDASAIADDFSDATLHRHSTTSSDTELSATITDMHFDVHQTDNSWHHNIASTPDDADALRTQQEETMLIKVLRAKEKAWGPDDPTTIDTVRKLGEFYASHGRMPEAEAMYLRVLKSPKSLSAYEQSGG